MKRENEDILLTAVILILLGLMTIRFFQVSKRNEILQQQQIHADSLLKIKRDSVKNECARNLSMRGVDLLQAEGFCSEGGR